ncbi:hypothetical protein FQR65_LT15477 [Abscondita terminalis]|nr:hypothetical protein FQR65_LT15477 [Abscondita terminalis]
MNQQEFDNRLANVLGSYPALWKRSSADFKNKTKKQNALMHLAKLLQTNTTYVLARIKALRERYRKERIRTTDLTRSDSSQVEHEEWYLYHTLSFFDEVMVSRKTTSNMCSREESKADLEMNIGTSESSIELDSEQDYMESTRNDYEQEDDGGDVIIELDADFEGCIVDNTPVVQETPIKI